MHWERNDDPPPLPKPRGKPEAMAQRLAAARVQANLEELEAERREAAASESKVETATAEIISKPPPPPPPPPKNVGKPNVNPEGGVLVQATTLVKPPKKKKVTKPRKKPQLPISKKRKTVHLIETAKPITEAEYENLEALMKQFCRVPLLAEFSRPISLLHPEVSNVSC